MDARLGLAQLGTNAGLSVSAGSDFIPLLMNNGPQQVQQQITHIEQEPFQAANIALTDGGLVNVLSGISGSGALGVLGGLSVVAGWRQRKHLTKQISQCNHALQMMPVSVESQHSRVVAHNKQLDIQKNSLLKARFYLKHQKSALKWSMMAGGLAAFKGFSELGTQLALGIQSVLAGKSFLALADLAQVGLAASAASVVGLGGTFVAPLIGVCSTIHARKMWNKSKTIRSDICSSFAFAYQNIQKAFSPNTLSANQPNSGFTAKCDALKSFMLDRAAKSEKKLHSAVWFNRNLFHLSALFTATAATKAIVVGLALGGIAALASNPVGWGVLLGATLAFGIGMAYYAIRAYRANKHQDQLLAIETQNHHLVDKDLIVRYTRIMVDQNVNMPPAQHIAAETLNHLQTREVGVRQFLGLTDKQGFKVTERAVKIAFKDDVSKFKQFALADMNAKLAVMRACQQALIAEYQDLNIPNPTEAEQGYFRHIQENLNSLQAQIGALNRVLTQMKGLNDGTKLECYRNALKFWNPSLDAGQVEQMDLATVTAALVRYVSKSMLKDIDAAKGVLHAGLVQAYLPANMHAMDGLVAQPQAPQAQVPQPQVP